MKTFDDNHQPGVPMLVPAGLERFQIKYVNPIVKPIARFLPGFAQVSHRGRTSGRHYVTTVNAFRKGNSISIGLIHGKTNWSKNVVAAGGAEIKLFGKRSTQLINPRYVAQGQGDPALTAATRRMNKRAGVFVADLAK